MAIKLNRAQVKEIRRVMQTALIALPNTTSSDVTDAVSGMVAVMSEELAKDKERKQQAKLPKPNAHHYSDQGVTFTRNDHIIKLEFGKCELQAVGDEFAVWVGGRKVIKWGPEYGDGVQKPEDVRKGMLAGDVLAGGL